MIDFSVYASDFQLFPGQGEAFDLLNPLIRGMRNITYSFQVKDPSKNQGQMTSDFDDQLQRAFLSQGANEYNLSLPSDMRQELDFTFEYKGHSVAVEIEKTNREKILRDILKSHMYLYYGADFALLVLPENYPHSHGCWDLFEFGADMYSKCRQYGFGTLDKLSRILLLGFTQYDAMNNERLSSQIRQQMRKKAAGSQ